MINLHYYTTQIVLQDGIYFSNKTSEISYPATGNEDFFQIEDQSFWFLHRNQCITEAVLHYSPNQVFFDIGGGNGFVAKGLQSAGIQTVLVEPGIQGCLNAKKRNLEYILCSTLENAAFNKNKLPAIGLFDVVEHIEKETEFLQTIYDLLLENGLVFITVPAYNALWSDEDIAAGHFRRYRARELEKKLKQIGFSVEYSTYIFSILIIAVFLFRTLPYTLGYVRKNIQRKDVHQKDHQEKKGWLGKLLMLIWNYEIRKIRNKNKIPFGGSCFVVARKVVKTLDQDPV
ncbi:MAG: class I SAM-dependent methyltransferase [Bacteroidetes Order II. Incertae sedis bacterium]|nr:class I SAM-dependent methyltransferase [Bacteroidetes Order II. bacterium]